MGLELEASPGFLSRLPSTPFSRNNKEMKREKLQPPRWGCRSPEGFPPLPAPPRMGEIRFRPGHRGFIPALGRGKA